MQPFLNISEVHKFYTLGETKVHALRGVNLQIQAGEFAAVIGTSGAGKSTLLHLIGCLDQPTSGTVELDGQAVHLLSDDDRSALRNKKIGFIFQSFNLIPVINVFENIELPLLINSDVPKSERETRVKQAIHDVGLDQFVHHIPDKLSGGQRQRVAIARALVGHPALILADEPTANLDSKTAHHIIDLMQELNQKRKVTFLFSTHDEKLMGRVQRVIRIHDGVIVT
jgi:putative ABC transport system ATP-binding protein